MTPAERAVRATSFGAVADDYDRCRPGPPTAAVAWCVPPGARAALDLGAGTGRLTQALVTLVPEVLAVDPDDRMLSVLARRAPAARRVAARAEALPLGTAVTDMVGVSSAWHWMDPERAVPEIARVLRPGGVLAVLWSGPDRSVPWVTDVLEPVRRPAPAAGASPRRRLDLPPGAPFEPPESITFFLSVPYRVGDLVGLAASFSSMITLPPDERAGAMATVARRVAARPELTGRQEVALPVRCIAWRAVRREA